MNEDTLLHRQVNPAFVQADVVSAQAFTVSSQVFKPTPKDDKKLSVYNGEKFSSEEAFLHYTSSGYSSAGVLSLTVAECGAEALGTFEDNNPFNGHAYIDFTNLGGSVIERKAKILKKYALDRGWQYGPAK